MGSIEAEVFLYEVYSYIVDLPSSGGLCESLVNFCHHMFGFQMVRGPFKRDSFSLRIILLSFTLHEMYNVPLFLVSV